MKFIFTFFFSLCISLFGVAQNDTCLNTLNLGISFPPVGDSNERSFTKTHLDKLDVVKIRFAEEWAFREPSKGNFSWAPLDERMDWADNNNFEVLLTIQSNAPSWACSSKKNVKSCVFKDNNDFKAYMDLLLKRYSGKIDKIQFGNEWQSDFWYIGNAGEFIAANNVLSQSVQQYSPGTKVVLGGFTAISLRFLAGCNGLVNSFYDDDGNFYDSVFLAQNCSSPNILKIKSRIDSVLRFAKYDILDLHLYDDVEQWDEYYLNFSDTISKPIIVSEFGGPNMNYEPYSESYQADRLYQYIKKLDSLHIQEAYFFKLVEGTGNPAHTTSGLIEKVTLREKQAYHVFDAFAGCTTFVKNKEYERRIKIYPNPMQDFSIVEFQSGNLVSRKSLLLYNSVGRMVRVVKDINKNYVILERQGLSSGYYLIVIRDDSGVVVRGKLIVQ
jgi:type IX secretion system substrate protein